MGRSRGPEGPLRVGTRSGGATQPAQSWEGSDQVHSLLPWNPTPIPVKVIHSKGRRFFFLTVEIMPLHYKQFENCRKI